MSSNYTLEFKAAHSGWHQFLLHNKNKIKRKITGKTGLPWMNQKEIDILWEIIKNRRPSNCLEWGAGFSTLYFPGLLPTKFQWTSIEHSEEWARLIEEKNTSRNVSVVYVAPDRLDPEGEGTEEEFSSYIRYAEQRAPYDFILIDGRARKHCCKKAFDLLKDDGVVVIHDVNRKSYLEYTSPFAHQLLFTDYRRTAGGLWIGSKALPLTNIIDVRQHKKAWQVQDVLGKIIRFRYLRKKIR